ncbi:nucleotide exchange factor GrpE [Qipengyuania sp.]|uniref:nucleotide exchange factor GrpE n=1 Tax=Qipengyuania sp. TaxID=2004515 RepID=UPI003AF8A760
MNNENKHEPQKQAVDEEVAREMEGVPEHLRSDSDGDETDSDDKALEEALSKLRGDLETAMQDVLYARAETQNVRRRLEKDVQDARNYAATGFARDILSVADNLARALDHVPEELREHEKAKNFIAGIEATMRELEKVFNANGITRIAAKGMPLDPNQHQAMMEIPTEEAEPGTIVQEMQAGYMIKDRLLRPAMVGVAKKPD